MVTVSYDGVIFHFRVSTTKHFTLKSSNSLTYLKSKSSENERMLSRFSSTAECVSGGRHIGRGNIYSAKTGKVIITKMIMSMNKCRSMKCSKTFSKFKNVAIFNQEIVLDVENWRRWLKCFCTIPTLVPIN